MPDVCKVTHLDLQLEADSHNRVLSGLATYQIQCSGNAESIVFDTRDLTIQSVLVDGDTTEKWWVGEKNKLLGSPLHIEVKPQSHEVTIAYVTSPGALALQWLNPEQTFGKRHPFLYSQSQAILARSWVPCQDTPGVRFTYNAKVKVPEGLMALMSASNPTVADSSGHYQFSMAQPIPSYLLAIAIGDVKFMPITDRAGVYAEPEILNEAVHEFADVGKMMEAAERLYGAYAWQRYDILVLPPSFPFGGMENPRLTFATPTIIAGDRSLTSLIAHELAHSWSGNLVTNATWNDFWLNEGFTVYVERRIMEEVYGNDYAEMLAQLGWQDLQRTLAEMGERNPDTKLKLDLQGRDPDDGMTDIAYEKGYFLLRTLERDIGRENFDEFLNAYFSDHAFQSLTTEQFVDYFTSWLKEKNLKTTVDLHDWIYETGLPGEVAIPQSQEFDRVEDALKRYLDDPGSKPDVSNWTTHHLLHFLRSLPDTLSQERVKAIDSDFDFTHSTNAEIAAEWYVYTLSRGARIADEQIEEFLIRVGRRKFLIPIYKAMLTADTTGNWPLSVYRKARPGYHSVSVSTLDELLNYTPQTHGAG
ncbi:MAG: M1 family metallopeptidase [Salibacteraceae bacterium]